MPTWSVLESKAHTELTRITSSRQCLSQALLAIPNAECLGRAGSDSKKEGSKSTQQCKEFKRIFQLWQIRLEKQSKAKPQRSPTNRSSDALPLRKAAPLDSLPLPRRWHALLTTRAEHLPPEQLVKFQATHNITLKHPMTEAKPGIVSVLTVSSKGLRKHYILRGTVKEPEGYYLYSHWSWHWMLS